MPSTFTPRLRLEDQVPGENLNTWGERADANFLRLEEATESSEEIDVAGSANVTLTALNAVADQARRRVLKFLGVLTGNIQVIIPAFGKNYVVHNATTGNFTLTLIPSGGIGLVIPQGYAGRVWCNGARVWQGAPWVVPTTGVARGADGIARADLATVSQAQLGTLHWGGVATGDNALVISVTPALTSYVNGMEIWWRKGANANTDDMTLNSNAIGAKSLLKAIGVQIEPGEAPAQAIMGARYIQAEDAFVAIAGLSDLDGQKPQVGDLKESMRLSCPGWLLLNGDTLGSALSGATQASDIYEALFLELWNSLADAQAPVVGGRGGSAAADWAANKRITLPGARGRTIIGSGSGSGLTARTHGATGGAETDVTTAGSGSSIGAGDGGLDTRSAGHTHTADIMQPWLAANIFIKY